MAGAGPVTRGAGAEAWSAWTPLDGLPALTPPVLAELLDGGQTFRWYQSGGDAASPPRLESTTTAAATHSPQPRGDSPATPGKSIQSGGDAASPPRRASPAAAAAATHWPQRRGDSPEIPVRSTCWTGVWSDNVASVRLAATGTLEWSAPSAIAARVETALRTYLGGAANFGACTDALPWRSDPHLAACMAAFPGLRILRQPFGETLLCFLCSATKQIVQIKQMVALLAERHGHPICPMWAGCPHRASQLGACERDSSADELASDGGPRSRAPSGVRAPHLQIGRRRTLNALPTWDELAQISEAELRRCLLGFRAKYIAQTAHFLAAHAGWLEETESLPYAQAKERLCSLPGVGEKVADCVLLFGAGRLEAFPVDVWILKTMARRYDLHGWKPAQLARFGRVHFGSYAGLAQQFLFAWERQEGRRRAS